MNDLIQLPKTTISLVGARFAPDITFEEWAEIGKQAFRYREAIQWTIGDWYNFGLGWVENAGREAPIMQKRFDVAIKALHFADQTLADFKWVAKHVEFSRRREKLSFSHHKEVAGLEPKEQDKYLRLAEANGLSVADLRELLRLRKREVDDSKGPPPLPSANHLAHELWLILSKEDPASWPKARREVVREDLRPIVEFYQKL